jgi:hypothetical protein
MFSEDFNPSQRLATEKCPRCHSVGLAVPDADTCANLTEANRHIDAVHVSPDITAWCPACGLVGNWPGMCWET